MVIAAVLFTVTAIGSGLAFGAGDLIVWRIIGGAGRRRGIGDRPGLHRRDLARRDPRAARLAAAARHRRSASSSPCCRDCAPGAGRGRLGPRTLWFGLDAWRWMFMTEVIPAVVYGVLALQHPRVARVIWSRRGNGGRARARCWRSVLRRRRRPPDHGRSAARSSRDAQTSLERPARPGGRACCRSSGSGIALSVFQQFVGINVIFYYSSTLWQSVGFSEADALADDGASPRSPTSS